MRSRLLRMASPTVHKKQQKNGSPKGAVKALFSSNTRMRGERYEAISQHNISAHNTGPTN